MIMSGSNITTLFPGTQVADNQSLFSKLKLEKQTELAERMIALHQWSPHAHGHYWSTAQEPRGECIKNDISKSCKVIWEPITTELMLKHLRGEYALGGFPLWNDSTCLHGVIDVDNYALDFSDLARRIEQAKLPLMLAATKSGGGRVFMPCKERFSAEFIRKVLAKCRLLLGLNDGSAKEIFPKQDRWRQNDPDFCGNWYALPYLGESWRGKSYPQVAIGPNGGWYTLEEYLYFYEKSQSSYEDLEAILARNTRKSGIGSGDVWSENLTDDEFLAGAPPCIHNMNTSRVHEGERNICLTHCTAFARKKYPDNIQGTLNRLNGMLMPCPLPDEEVSKLAQRTRNKEIGKGYMCKEESVSGYCDKETCRKVKYGAFTKNGGDVPDAPFEISIDEMNGELRTAFVTVNGHVIRISAGDLMDYRKFIRIAMDQEGLDIGAFDKSKFIKGVHDAWEERGHIPPPPGFEPYSTYSRYFADYVMFKTQLKEVPSVGQETRTAWVDVSVEPPVFVFKMEDLALFVSNRFFHELDKLKMREVIRKVRGGDSYGDDYGERRRKRCWWVLLTEDEQLSRTDWLRGLRNAWESEKQQEKEAVDRENF
jgi:hypothetical protein